MQAAVGGPVFGDQPALHRALDRSGKGSLAHHIGKGAFIAVDREQFERGRDLAQRVRPGQRGIGLLRLIHGKGCFPGGRGVSGRRQREHRAGRFADRNGRSRTPRQRAEPPGHKGCKAAGAEIVGVGVVAGIEPPLGALPALGTDAFHRIAVQVDHRDLFLPAQIKDRGRIFGQQVVVPAVGGPGVARQRRDQDGLCAPGPDGPQIAAQPFGVAAPGSEMRELLVIVAELQQAEVPRPQPRFDNGPVAALGKTLGRQAGVGMVGNAPVPRQEPAEHLAPARIAGAGGIGQARALVGDGGVPHQEHPRHRSGLQAHRLQVCPRHGQIGRRLEGGLCLAVRHKRRHIEREAQFPHLAFCQGALPHQAAASRKDPDRSAPAAQPQRNLIGPLARQVGPEPDRQFPSRQVGGGQAGGGAGRNTPGPGRKARAPAAVPPHRLPVGGHLGGVQPRGILQGGGVHKSGSGAAAVGHRRTGHGEIKDRLHLTGPRHCASCRSSARRTGRPAPGPGPSPESSHG